MASGIPTALVVIGAIFVGGNILLQEVGVTDPGKTLGPTSSGDDFIDALAGAIAHAEGYFDGNPLSRPRRNNNPGDITDMYLAVSRDNGGLSVFASPEDGWTALYAKLRNIMNGGSSVYSRSMSITQMAYTWTGMDNAVGWADTVASKLSAAGYPASPTDSLTTVAV